MCVRTYVHTYVHTYVRMYVHVCHAQECQIVNLRSCARRRTYASRALTHEDTRCAYMAKEDREERRFLTIEEGWDSAAGPLQRTCIAESSTERSRRLAALRKRKQ